jgi:hypothetical protein
MKTGRWTNLDNPSYNTSGHVFVCGMVGSFLILPSLDLLLKTQISADSGLSLVAEDLNNIT